MKNLLIIIFLLGSVSVFCQFKDDPARGGTNQPNIKEGILKKPSSDVWLGLIDPNNFHMGHSYSLSYSSFGSNGIALGVYTNSIYYRISENFDFQMNTSFVNSPYSSLGKNFQNSINGIYLDRIQLNYQPSKDFLISIQYSNNPYNYYHGGGNFWNRGYKHFYYWGEDLNR